jgi:hypothetical protein
MSEIPGPFDEEMKRIREENALYSMSLEEAEVLLAPSEPIPDLIKTGQKLMLGILEPVHSMEINGHKVGWLKFTSSRDPEFTGTSLHCECDLKYDVRIDDEGKERVSRGYTPPCIAKKTAMIARAAMIGAEYGFNHQTRQDPTFEFRATYPLEKVEDTISSVVRRVYENEEWMGNWDGDFIGAMTLFDILGMPKGDNRTGGHVLKRNNPWGYFSDMQEKGKLEISHDWVLTIPHLDGIAMPDAEKLDDSKPLVQWEDNEIFNPDVVWFTRVDGRYLVEVRDQGETQPMSYRIYDHQEGDKEVYRQDVNPIQRAIFGVDVSDVSEWQETALHVIDGQSQK